MGLAILAGMARMSLHLALEGCDLLLLSVPTLILAQVFSAIAISTG
jgi:hypothetical protein